MVTIQKINPFNKQTPKISLFSVHLEFEILRNIVDLSFIYTLYFQTASITCLTSTITYAKTVYKCPKSCRDYEPFYLIHKIIEWQCWGILENCAEIETKCWLPIMLRIQRCSGSGLLAYSHLSTKRKYNQIDIQNQFCNRINLIPLKCG